MKETKTKIIWNAQRNRANDSVAWRTAEARYVNAWRKCKYVIIIIWSFAVLPCVALCSHKAERHTQLSIPLRSALRLRCSFNIVLLLCYISLSSRVLSFFRRSGFALFFILLTLLAHCVRECATIVTAAILSLLATCAHECKQKTHIKCAWFTSWRLCRETGDEKINVTEKSKNRINVSTAHSWLPHKMHNSEWVAFCVQQKTKKRAKNGRNNNNKWELQCTATSECAQPTKCVLDASPEQDQQQLADSDTIV